MDNISTKKNIGYRLATLFNKTNKKQKELAGYLEVKPNVVSYFVNGERVPNTEQVIKIATFFNVSTDYLLGLTEADTSNKDLQFVCDYTGLNKNAVSRLHSEKSEYFSTVINFLLENKELIKSLGTYLVSSVYEEYKNSDYIHLPLKSKEVYINNPSLAKKVAYSNLLEMLPQQKEKMTAEIQNNPALKETLLYRLAENIVDINKCKFIVNDYQGWSDEPLEKFYEEHYDEIYNYTDIDFELESIEYERLEEEAEAKSRKQFEVAMGFLNNLKKAGEP